MPNPTGVGFFGKLPGTGDFVQRRLPASFVDAWDHHFEQAVSASRAQIGDDWAQAWQDAAVWRFVLSPGICGEQAWAGVTGTATDRVGRCFPMAIAAPLANAAASAVALRNDAWFDAAERAHREAQAGGEGVDAFDARVAALPDPLVPGAAAPAAVPTLDWQGATHWRLPLPSLVDTGWLCALWAELPPGHALWWTLGAPRMPASVLATRGLPEPSLYAGMLDVAHAGMPRQATAATDAAPRVARPSATPPVRLPDDLSELFADLAPRLDDIAQSTNEPDPAEVTQRAAGVGGARVLHRYDCALTLVVADDGAPDPRRQAAATVSELIGRFVPSDFVAGMQALRTRLLVLHTRLRQMAAGHATPVQEDGAVIAVRVTGRWADLLRIGTASAWHWRAGQLHPLFAGGERPAGDAELGGELDDLLFTRTSPVAPGLGASTQPICDEIVCEIDTGDRLLLLATRQLAELPAPVLAEALALPSPDAACARIAAAAGLGSHAAAWPLAVIEVQP
ncbi:type VI secretion system-associated protein TagF [Rhodanobacter sp. DHB23]|uniref:type VI secretion system-associated protein TagF n=1 Tax=Rhodanobacter sp. DHB23 TaxID=2775923 RepID=UPI00177CA55E|nr:type VI secretion system-associated protein TagF [Rhodanobacter sp. DHB23]MBD8871351.1 type VI secretion system-associated protein TagF [Rhodanobacter sp. DHB23]